MALIGDRTFLAVYFPQLEKAAIYVDIESGQVLNTDAVYRQERLALGRWRIETRVDRNWVREFSYPDDVTPDIGEAFPDAELLPEHI